jgi:hypothetical protein
MSHLTTFLVALSIGRFYNFRRVCKLAIGFCEHSLGSVFLFLFKDGGGKFQYFILLMEIIGSSYNKIYKEYNEA